MKRPGYRSPLRTRRIIGKRADDVICSVPKTYRANSVRYTLRIKSDVHLQLRQSRNEEGTAVSGIAVSVDPVTILACTSLRRH